MSTNSASEMSSRGQLPFERSWVSMKYFIASSPLFLVLALDRVRSGLAPGRRRPRPMNGRGLYMQAHDHVRRHSGAGAACLREARRRQADPANALLPEQRARALLGAAPGVMRVAQEPRPARGDPEQVGTRVRGRDRLQPTTGPHSVDVATQGGRLEIEGPTH